jgi:hypothetical protein
MQRLLVRYKSDEVRHPLIKIGVKTLTSRHERRAQSSAHDDFVRPAGHSNFPSSVVIDAHGRVVACQRPRQYRNDLSHEGVGWSIFTLALSSTSNVTVCPGSLESVPEWGHAASAGLDREPTITLQG